MQMGNGEFPVPVMQLLETGNCYVAIYFQLRLGVTCSKCGNCKAAVTPRSICKNTVQAPRKDGPRRAPLEAWHEQEPPNRPTKDPEVE